MGRPVRFAVALYGVYRELDAGLTQPLLAAAAELGKGQVLPSLVLA